MALVTFKHIGKEYTGRWLFKDVNLEITAGRKIGLIGANGSGKTTLLRLLCQQEKPDTGKIEIHADTRIAHVAQHVTFHGGQTVRDYVMRDYCQCADFLRQSEKAAAEAHDHQLDKVLSQYQRARDHYDQIGGDHFPQRAQSMLEGLGLGPHADQHVERLSGGEQNILAMATALLAEPNLLLLDEPGNHLDYQALAWLESFLAQFRGTILVVSHNRYLLDRVATDILEVENESIRHYPGNYSDYKRVKSERLKAQHQQYQAQQQRLDHLRQMVQKFADIAAGHASDNTWGRRLRARKSQLARAESEAIDKPTANRQATLRFQADQSRADIALQVNGYSKAFGDNVLFERADLQVTSGQRWALVGANGCGKTTLIRDIIATASWENKTLRIGPSFSVGYCAQQQELLNPEATVFDDLYYTADANEQQVLNILARLLFTDQEIHKKVKNLSGGERNRLQLARLMLENPNFLILDEPTNHLDIPTREAVEQALSEYAGTILVVSHDRYFLDKVVDHVALVQNKTLKSYSGNFTTFFQAVQAQHTAEGSAGRITTRHRERDDVDQIKEKNGGAQWRQRKAAAAELRKAQKQCERLETAIAQAEEKKESLTQQVADAFSRGDHDTGTQLSDELNEAAKHVETLYSQWMQAQDHAGRIAEANADTAD